MDSAGCGFDCLAGCPMPTDTTAAELAYAGRETGSRRKWRQQPGTVRALRLAIAATTGLLIALLVNWPLAFVTPALVVAFLEIPIPKPSLRDFAAFLGYAVFGIGGVFLLVMLFQPYPLIFICVYTLAVFLCPYFLHKGAPLVLILIIFLGLLTLPIVGNVDEGATVFLAGCLLFSVLLALVIIQVVYSVLPDPPGSPDNESPGFQAGYSAHAARAATVTAIIMAPAMTAFLAFNWASQLVVMLYIGLISLEGSRSHSVYDTKKYLMANTFGAMGALIFYLVIVAVPQIGVVALLTLVFTLLFSCRRFSDAPDAKFFGSALIGLIILISSSIGAGADMDANIVKRISYIFLAGMYVIGVASIIEPLIAHSSDHATA